MNPLMPGGIKGHTYLNKPAAKRSRLAFSMCDLLLLPGMKRLSARNAFLVAITLTTKAP